MNIVVRETEQFFVISFQRDLFIHLCEKGV